MTKTSLRTHVLFPDQLKYILLPRSWSPEMESDCSGVCVCVCVRHGALTVMHITSMQLQHNPKEEKMIARQRRSDGVR